MKMNMKWIAAIVAVIIVVAAVGTYYIMTKPTAPGEELKVGFFGPMGLGDGFDQLNLIILAAERINAEGGLLGRPIKVLSIDDKNDATVAREAARSLAERGCELIIGTYASGTALAAQEALADYQNETGKKFIYMVGGSTPKIAWKVRDNYERYKYCFHVFPPNSWYAWYAVHYADYLNKKYGVTNIGIVRDDALWAEDVVHYPDYGMEKLLKDFPALKIVAEEKVPVGTTDFKPTLLKLKAAGTQILVRLVAMSSSVALDIQVNELELPVFTLGIDHDAQAIDAWKTTGGKIKYIVTMSDVGLVYAPLFPTTKQLWDSFEERFGYAVRRAIPVQGYLAMIYFEEAVKRAGKAGESDPFDPDVIVKYLEGINKNNPMTNTPFGKLAFNEYHETILDVENDFFPYVMFQWVGDRQQVIVWPEKYKTGDLQLPPWLEAALPG